MAENNFAEKIVFISGAARGFGKSTAQRFFDQGASLVLNDVDEAMLEKAMAPYAKHSDRVVGIAGDIGKPETSMKAANLADETFGGLDIAINNAGILHPQARLDTLDSEAVEKVIQVNLLGVFYAMKHQLPLMMKRHQQTGEQCNIVNMGSAAALMGSPMLSAYAAAKHGVIGLTRSVSIEYASKGIRINAVCPSFADTHMANDALNESRHEFEEAQKRMVAGVPLKRLATVDEVVQAILWVCSASNSFYTGQALSIDGGLSTF